MNNNMYLYFDSNGYLKEFITCPARAGSENVNSIYFYVEPALESDRNKVDGNGDAYYALPNNLDHGVLTFKLHDVLDGVTDENGTVLNSLAFTSANFRIKDIQPFDKKRDLLFFKWFQKYQFVKVDLTADILLNAGNVECTIGCYNASNTKVYNLDLFSFYVADSAVQSANYVTTSQYHMLLALMQSGLSSAVMRYNVLYSNTLADVYDLIGTQIAVLNIEGDEYLCEMSDTGSIVLYDIYSQEWYAFTGANTTTINDVLNDQYKHKILTEEIANDTFLKLIGGTLTGRLIIEDNLNTSKLVIRGATSGQSYIQIYNNDNSHSSYLGTDNTGSLITYEGGYWRQLSTKKYVDDKVAALGTVLNYKGTKTVAEINALTNMQVGDVYNVSDSGTLTQGNISVVAGDNVAWNGSAWDKLAGDIDLSGYVLKSQKIAGLQLSGDISENALFDRMNIKGVYATLTALQTANPSHDYCYLVEENNHWYYWNGSAWTDGGVYQNGDLISNIEKGLFLITGSSNKKIDMIEGAYYDLSGSTITIGSPITNSAKKYALVPCEEDDVFNISTTSGESAQPWAFVDENGNILEKTGNRGMGTIVISKTIVVAPANSAYLVINGDRNITDVSYYDYQKNNAKNIITKKKVFYNKELFVRQTAGTDTTNRNLVWYDSTTRICIKPLIDIGNVGKSFIVKPNAGYRYILYMFDENEKFVNGSYYFQANWQTSERLYTINNKTKYITIVISKTDDSTIYLDEYENVEITCLDYCLQNELDEIIEKLNEPEEQELPKYWLEYLDSKKGVLSEKEMSLGYKGVSFAFITDSHIDMNNGNSPKILTYLSKHSNLRDVVFGGDLIVDYTSKENAIKQLYRWTQNTAELKIVNLHGNHDNNSNNQTDNTQVLTDADFYALECKQSENRVNWVENSLYGYEDNEAQKVRYIYLDTGAPDNAVISDAQITWMQAKISELASGWTVIVFCHQFFNGYVKETPTLSLDPNGTKIMNGLNDIYDNIDATICCVICGHCHRNYNMISSKGYPIIATTCDSGGTQASTYDPDTPNRVKGTITEQAFDLYYINTTNRTIDIVRIGAGDDEQDRNFTY